jgi:hypothetical protein
VPLICYLTVARIPRKEREMSTLKQVATDPTAAAWAGQGARLPLPVRRRALLIAVAVAISIAVLIAGAGLLRGDPLLDQTAQPTFTRTVPGAVLSTLGLGGAVAAGVLHSVPAPIAASAAVLVPLAAAFAVVVLLGPFAIAVPALLMLVDLLRDVARVLLGGPG